MTTSVSSKIRDASLALGFAAFVSILSSTTSFAYTAEAQQMCTGDAFRLCSSEIPNIPKITACSLNEALAEQVIRDLMDAVATVGGVATLLFHPHSLVKPAFARLYRFAIEYGLERGAWFGTLKEIADWWRVTTGRAQRRVVEFVAADHLAGRADRAVGDQPCLAIAEM